ncbi:kinase-like domain-containing protein [Glomus cerebriforme]|uniref:Kinase-like domain-containing protein n=1 Tax=Glomus cerebriforme TaxID=658196 RepID=A0A397TBE3_9GLOM|nr:kinase-like domain-containing protein [Glomus cerebriforme]
MTSTSSDFLNEVKNNLKLGSGCCIQIYGVTRDTQNGEYAIVIEFKNGGNLREFIKKNHSILNWENISHILRNICIGLNDIHVNNYHHKDFHSGNILNQLVNNGNIYSVISDFGLSCPMERNAEDKTLYGVLPFVAPEVLRGGEFTKAADIYGFGMLMSEIISGEVPFIDRDYDLHLAFDICEGKRPLIPEYTPEPYADLMKSCWDPDPTNRPTAYELQKKFDYWFNIHLIYNSSKSIQSNEQLFIEKVFSYEREIMWKTRLAELAKNLHPLKKSQNLLTSKRLDFSKQLLAIRNVKTNDKLETKDVEMKKNDDGI